MEKLAVQNLSKHFESGAGLAVDHVSFEAKQGETISLLGPSGCGKTTTLRCIAGLEYPDQGEIWLNQRQITKGPLHLVPPERRGMGMVFQSYSIWPHMTVGENIALGLRAKGTNRTDAERKVEESLARVHLSGLAKRPATDLSGGQQQRVALARSLALEPQVLLFDEPLSNLDANLREEMRVELRDLLQQLGVTSIYVTHDQSEAFVLSDRILVMESGRIVQAGRPEEIYLRPATRFIAQFIGSANILSGRFIALQDGCAIIELPDGQTLRASGKGNPDDAVEVCVRPEAIHLEIPVSGERQPNTLRGIVQQGLYLGNRVEYRVTMGSESVRISTLPSIRVESGTAVAVRIAPEDAQVLSRGPDPSANRSLQE